jgi:hypothetical protein
MNITAVQTELLLSHKHVFLLKLGNQPGGPKVQPCSLTLLRITGEKTSHTEQKILKSWSYQRSTDLARCILFSGNRADNDPIHTNITPSNVVVSELALAGHCSGHQEELTNFYITSSVMLNQQITENTIASIESHTTTP